VSSDAPGFHERSLLVPTGERVKRRDFVLLLAGAMMAPRVLYAQQKVMPVIGFLNTGSPDTDLPFLAAFRHGLGDAGFVEGQNVAMEHRWAEGQAAFLRSSTASDIFTVRRQGF